MRTRGSAVLLKEYQVMLIRRVRDAQEYYVFPGGGAEHDETPEEATIREAWEELGVHVKVGECIALVECSGPQYFYLCEIIEGEIGTGKGEEFLTLDTGRGTYEPMWVPLLALKKLDVRPNELVGILLENSRS